MSKKGLVILMSFTSLVGCAGRAPNLGVKNGELAPCPDTPNCVNSQTDIETHSIQPITYAGSQHEARTRLIQILESEERTNIITNQENYIRVEFTSALFRFVDDVEFYLSEAQPGETLIHIRSASRVGYHDLGANRKRVERIRNAFSKEDVAEQSKK